MLGAIYQPKLPDLPPTIKGMKIDTVVGEILKKELKPIGDSMTADWLKSAGAEGKAIIDAYNKK